MTRLGCIALLLSVVQGQPRPSTLQGHVVRAGSRAPVAHARVVAARVGGTLDDYRTAISDAGGGFTFDGVSAGTYRLYATRDGYLPAEFGRRSVAGSGIPVIVAEGQVSPDLEVAMTPTGVITGHVWRGDEPMANAWVRALRARYIDGERSFGVADWTQTDDRGEYRLFGLSPGSYVVTAVPRRHATIDGESIVTPALATNANGNQLSERTKLTQDTVEAASFERGVYPTTYFPAAIDPTAAQPIELAAGATVTGIDFSLTPSEPFHVRGQVVVADAVAAAAPVRVAIQPADTGYALPLASVRAEPSGAFDLGGVPPGRYYLSIQTQGPGTAVSDLVALNVLDRDPPPVFVTLRRGVTVTGRLTIEGRDVEPGDPPILVQLYGVNTRGTCCGARRVGDGGTFTFDNVPSRDYRLRVLQTGRPFWIKSARFGEDDVVASPVRITGDPQGRELDIVLSARTAAIDALVVDGDQRPAPGVLVVAVPPAERRNQSSAYRSATSGGDGHARIDGLAPGDYTLFASESIDAADWQDPAVVQRHQARGAVVQIREGDSRTITVRIVP